MMNLMQAPYLREQRSFPQDDLKTLSSQLDQAYIDIAIKMNVRTIGTFAVNAPIVTGEQWYVKGEPQKQQTLRRVYLIPPGGGSIAHGIILNQIGGFTRIYGTFTDGTNWYPLPYVDATAIGNQVQVVVTPMNIVITRGASAPAITSGYCILEWLGVFSK